MIKLKVQNITNVEDLPTQIGGKSNSRASIHALKVWVLYNVSLCTVACYQ